MKNLILLTFLFCSFVYAEVAKVVAINGEANIQRGEKSIALSLDSLIEENDVINTSDNTKLQIIFKDETIITIGKNSTFAVNDFIFDEKQNEYKAEFGLLKGTFRTITGKIGKIAPDKFKLKSKSSSIGIRGTQILSQVEISGDTIFCTEGRIVITSMFTGEIIELQAGEYIEIKEGQPLVIKKFDVNTIKEADTNTKFLNDEEKESTLEQFGVTLTETQNETNAPAENNTENTNLEISTSINNTLTYDSLENATNSTISGTTGEFIQFNSGTYIKGSFSDNTATMSNTNYTTKFSLNNFSTNFAADNSYTSTLSGIGTVTYGGSTASFISGSYSSKPDGGDSTYKTNDDVQWGEWNALIGFSGSTNQNIQGYWIIGNQTSVSEVASLITNSVTANYSGYALGKDSMDNTFDASNTTVTFNIDFGGKTLTGSFDLGQFSTDINGTLSSSGFTFTPSEGGGSGSGKFFGSDAKSVGGSFFFNSGYTYSGVFKATKQ